MLGIMVLSIFFAAGCGRKEENTAPKDAQHNLEPEQVSTEELETRVKELEPEQENAYDYLALGNSVTLPEENEALWWGSYGMAASAPQNDYVHRVAEHLKAYYGKVNATAVNFQDWEENKLGDRSAYLSTLDGTVTEKLDLITVQLGENITANEASTQNDYENLVAYLREKAPDATILFLGQILWDNTTVQTIKQQVADAQGIPFLSFEDIRNVEIYEAGLGTEVLGDDGTLHPITNEVVAAHPNDLGMQLIAERINQTLDEQMKLK